ncbi:DUF2911 domain-containing protein [Owenweeksia hongkongensis]|uniref:DUF2911 domain-containing protein n=1 Tax=Owenweeksia hongkongensis TaxID=253245 RepID=UPI003A950A2E
MGKFLKWAVISLALIAGVLVIAFNILRSNTKKHSPEQVVEFKQDDLELSVFYNRPYKNEREIFGALVPYGEVWRTGANEPASFTTNKNITIDGKKLPAGSYTLWTIPNKNEWEVIWNDKDYGWGITLMEGKASRKAEYDVLNVLEPVKPTSKTIEQFTISFKKGSPILFVLEWDDTRIEVPIEE